MKGIALNIVILLIIGIISLLMLLAFFSKPVNEMISDTFCFFNNHVFRPLGINLGGEICEEDVCQAKRITIDLPGRNEIISKLSAYSLLCWQRMTPACGKSNICYSLILKYPVGEDITESNLTQYLENQGACHILENSKVVLEDGTVINYPACGEEDLIKWDIEGNVINNQKLILIQYDTRNNEIIIKSS